MSLEKRPLVTGALLAFVLVTGVTFAVRETRHARSLAAAEAGRAAVPAPSPVTAEGAPAPDAATPGKAAPVPVPGAGT